MLLIHMHSTQTNLFIQILIFVKVDIFRYHNMPTNNYG